MSVAINWRPWHGLEAAYMGEIIVGRVSVSRFKRAAAPISWQFALDGHPTFWHPAKSVEEARAEVEGKLQSWLEKAGLA